MSNKHRKFETEYNQMYLNCKTYYIIKHKINATVESNIIL